MSIIFLIFIFFNLMENSKENINPETVILQTELEEMGFETNHINIATQISKDREEVINL
jgi:hypothetical protein